MSTLDVVAEVLREVAPRALRAKEIAARGSDRLTTRSRTPETVVSRDLAIDVRDRGASSRFLRVGRGEFVLKEALPTAFYNDCDPYVAQWTRNLIAGGEIAPGVVDERSIRDLQPADVASYRQCHFFAGVGTWSRVLRDAEWPDEIPIFTGSCPCSPFSQAGRKKGFDDEQHLWPEWFRLIAACRPPVVVGEQVSSQDGLAWFDAVRLNLEGAGYSVGVLPFAHCPFSAFLIELPSEFLPLSGHTRPKCWISVLAVDAMRAVAVHTDSCGSEINLTAVRPEAIGGDEWFREEGLGSLAAGQDKTLLFEMRLAMRLASNTVAFVTTHRESVKKREGTPIDVRLLDVSCPREVCVDRSFRDQVISLVAARSIPRARGVLAHLVRGHWRRSGEGLIWIAPYRRGDENIGKIVERIERIETTTQERR